MVFQNIKINKEICDPIYNYIYITDVESRIIDTSEFQRLDRLLQTPTAHYIFPSATHTRKSHSLGVLHLADKCFKRILYRQSNNLRRQIPSFFYDNFVLGDLEQNNLDDLDEFWDFKEMINILHEFRIAGLCHDIGHGPFSHIFENACNSLITENKLEWDHSIDGKFKHEQMSSEIIKTSFDKILTEDEIVNITGILNNENYKYKFLNEILNSPYDIDKLDYVSRDAYHTGAIEYGNINYHRIMDGLRVLNKKLLISSDSIDSVINSITATQYMYSCVYQHPTARVFDFMLYDAIKKVPSYINKIINNYEEFISTDDYGFIKEVKNNRNKNEEYKASYNILKNVMNRKLLYKDICTEYISLDVSDDNSEKLQQIEKELVEEFSDYNLRFDYAEIRPIRINIKKIRAWLDSEKFYDDIEKKPITLKEISRSYYEMLLKLHVLFSIYMDYGEAKKAKNSQVIKKINRETKLQINELYKKYEK